MKSRTLLLAYSGLLVCVGAWFLLPKLIAKLVIHDDGGVYTVVRGATMCSLPNTNVRVYVESDRRHIIAIDQAGHILWTREPFSDGRLTPYRVDHPVLVSVGLSHSKQRPDGVDVHLLYDSSQSGRIDYVTGDFTFDEQK